MALLARSGSVALLRDAVLVATYRMRAARLVASGLRHLHHGPKLQQHRLLLAQTPATPTEKRKPLRRALATTTPQSPSVPPPSPSPAESHGSSATTGQDAGASTTALTEQSGSELVLSPPALVVTREYEWGNIILGFEQANRYTIRAAPGGAVVGYIAEESSMAGVVTRNVLRRRRPFRATVLDSHGNVVFRVRRPLYLVSSSLFVEDADGNPLGEVQMDWHVWRRRYALYTGKQQFAAIDSGLLAVDFDMRDVDGRKLAAVNKDFTGIARELFTDARQYVLRLDPRFGISADGVLVSDESTVNAEAADEAYSDERIDLEKRAVVLATAIAIDFDYFSLHSGGGMHPGFMMMPGGGGGGGGGGANAPAQVPPVTPIPPMGGGAGGAAGAAVGADVVSDPMSGDGGAENAGGFDDSGAQPASGFDDTNSEFGGNEDQGEWATFEEPDHGFDEGFPDEQVWTPDSEETMGQDFGGMSGEGGDEGGGIGGIFEALRDFFSDS